MLYKKRGVGLFYKKKILNSNIKLKPCCTIRTAIFIDETIQPLQYRHNISQNIKICKFTIINDLFRIKTYSSLRKIHLTCINSYISERNMESHELKKKGAAINGHRLQAKIRTCNLITLKIYDFLFQHLPLGH